MQNSSLPLRAAAIRANYHLPSLFDNLRQAGAELWRGPCPMHGGDNASGFKVERRTGEWRWRCFTGDCGGGSAIDVVMRREGCTFAEAVDILDGGIPAGRAEPAHAYRPANLGAAVPFPPAGLLVCDKCRVETLAVEPRTYGNGTRSRPYRTETLDEAIWRAADSAGWELSARAEFALGRECLERLHA